MSRPTQDTRRRCNFDRYGAFTLSGAAFLAASRSAASPYLESFYPRLAETIRVWACPFSLAATEGFDVSFFSSGYWDVSVPRVCALLRATHVIASGCPIRTSADQFPFANPRSFSQLTASFFASESLGIRHSLFCSFSCFSRSSVSRARYLFLICEIAADTPLFMRYPAHSVLSSLLFLVSFFLPLCQRSLP